LGSTIYQDEFKAARRLFEAEAEKAHYRTVGCHRNERRWLALPPGSTSPSSSALVRYNQEEDPEDQQLIRPVEEPHYVPEWEQGCTGSSCQPELAIEAGPSSSSTFVPVQLPAIEWRPPLPEQLDVILEDTPPMPVTPAFSSDQERVLEQAINSVMEN
jgi:hypothetical protein